MKPKKYRVCLSDGERKELRGIIKRGKHSASTIRRANILLDLDENTGVVGKQEEIAGRNNNELTRHQEPAHYCGDSK